MSEENVEMVRSTLERLQAATERGAPVGDSTPEGFADDWEWVVMDGMGGRSVWRGQEGFRDFFEDWTVEFDDWSLRVERFVDAGEDRVVALTRQSAVGKGSGALVETSIGQIYELEEGRVVRITNYPRHGDALEAAGLSE